MNELKVQTLIYHSSYRPKVKKFAILQLKDKNSLSNQDKNK